MGSAEKLRLALEEQERVSQVVDALQKNVQRKNDERALERKKSSKSEGAKSGSSAKITKKGNVSPR